MADVQTFTSPSGDEMVILPRAEYDALIKAAAGAAEDLADARMYDERKAALAGNIDEVMPAEVSALITKGDSLLKAVRKWRGKNQVETAELVGIAQSYLSALENGDRNMTAELAQKFATAFDVPVKWIE